MADEKQATTDVTKAIEAQVQEKLNAVAAGGAAQPETPPAANASEDNVRAAVDLALTRLRDLGHDPATIDVNQLTQLARDNIQRQQEELLTTLVSSVQPPQPVAPAPVTPAIVAETPAVPVVLETPAVPAAPASLAVPAVPVTPAAQTVLATVKDVSQGVKEAGKNILSV